MTLNWDILDVRASEHTAANRVLDMSFTWHEGKMHVFDELTDVCQKQKTWARYRTCRVESSRLKRLPGHPDLLCSFSSNHQRALVTLQRSTVCTCLWHWGKSAHNLPTHYYTAQHYKWPHKNSFLVPSSLLKPRLSSAALFSPTLTITAAPAHGHTFHKNHKESNGHQFKLNKTIKSKTMSLLFFKDGVRIFCSGVVR